MARPLAAAMARAPGSPLAALGHAREPGGPAAASGPAEPAASRGGLHLNSDNGGPAAESFHPLVAAPVSPPQPPTGLGGG